MRITMVGPIPVLMPDISQVPYSSVKPTPLPHYSTSLQYHMLAENPHKVTRDMTGARELPVDWDVCKAPPRFMHAYSNRVPPVTIKIKSFEGSIMNKLERVTYSANWGGGAFVNASVGDAITVLGIHGELVQGTLVKGKTIYGSDNDHGHNYPWTFDDYNIVLPSDPFNRQSSLLAALKAGTVVYVGHHDSSTMMRFRPHRGSLEASMAEMVLLPRSTEALVAYINEAGLSPFLEEPVTTVDLELDRGGYDERVQWHTVWVKVKGFGVIGCIDGAMPQQN